MGEDLKETPGGLTPKDLLLGVVFVLLGLIGAFVGSYAWWRVEQLGYPDAVGLFALVVFVCLIVWIIRQAEKQD
jgi:hypothetical protein